MFFLERVSKEAYERETAVLRNSQLVVEKSSHLPKCLTGHDLIWQNETIARNATLFGEHCYLIERGLIAQYKMLHGLDMSVIDGVIEEVS